MKGYVKDWRNETDYDLAMPHIQLKVWLLLRSRAQHQPYKGMKAGDLHITYGEMQEKIHHDDDRPATERELRTALIALEKMHYIERRVIPGQPMVVRITDWDRAQGPHPKGYEYIREGHEQPYGECFDPFALPAADYSDFEEESCRGQVVNIASRTASGERKKKNAKNDKNG